MHGIRLALYARRRWLLAAAAVAVCFLWWTTGECRRVAVDRAFAEKIVAGCAHDPATGLVYVAEGTFRKPWSVEFGPLRETVPGLVSLPEFVVIGHDSGWFSHSVARLVRIKSIRCIIELGV